MILQKNLNSSTLIKLLSLPFLIQYFTPLFTDDVLIWTVERFSLSFCVEGSKMLRGYESGFGLEGPGLIFGSK